MAEDAREKFRDDQRDVRGEAEERGAQAALEAVGRHAEIIKRNRDKNKPLICAHPR
jgi:hypothetical protein